MNHIENICRIYHFDLYCGHIINPDIQVELWHFILLVIISIIKVKLNEIITIFALFRFQSVTVLFSLRKASQVSCLPPKILICIVVLGGYVGICPSIYKTRIWHVEYTSVIIRVIFGGPTINAYESWYINAKEERYI